MKKSLGFTLIELMIAVAVIGILAGIAYPSYQDSVMKSRRRDAQGALMGLANAMERRFTEVNHYCDVGGVDGTGANFCKEAGINDTGTPSIYSATSPIDGGTPAYNLTISLMDANGTSYTLSATPTGVQAGDRCGTLTLDHTGARGFSGTGDCW